MIMKNFAAAVSAVFMFTVLAFAGDETSESYAFLTDPYVDWTIPVGETAYAVTDVALRDAPNGDFAGTLEEGETTDVIGYDDGGEWALTDGGWCLAGYLSSKPPVFHGIESDSDEAVRYVGFLNSEIACVPQRILDALGEAGYEIYLTTSNLGKDDLYMDGEDYEESTGVTLLTDGFCRTYVEAEPFAVRYSAVHEVGHAFCWLLGDPCFEEEFAYCYEEEKEYADTEHHREDELGYFASAFRDYLVEGETAFNDRHATYAYMDELIRAWS